MKKLALASVGTVVILFLTTSCSSSTPAVVQETASVVTSADQIRAGCDIWRLTANNADAGILTDEEIRLEIKKSYDLVVLGDDEALKLSAQKLLAQSTLVVNVGKRVGSNFDPQQELDPAIEMLYAKTNLNTLAQDFNQNCSRY
jgi:hypothetical protein